MKKLLVYMDDDFHGDLKELAHRKKTTMAALVRYALDATFEDDFDTIGSERAWEEYLKDPSASISLDDYLKERGIELPRRDSPKGAARTRQVAEGRGRYTV